MLLRNGKLTLKEQTVVQQEEIIVAQEEIIVSQEEIIVPQEEITVPQRNNTCAVCLEEVNSGGVIHCMCRCIPCKHVFCYLCLLKIGEGEAVSNTIYWFWRNESPKQCPVCRKLIKDFEVFNTTIQNHFIDVYQN
jgi:hypothetical protein